MFVAKNHNYIFRRRKVTFKLLSNTTSIFHGVENDLIFKYRKTLRRISS